MPGNAAEMIDTITKMTRASVGSSDQNSARPPTTPAIIRFERERRSCFRVATIACLRKSLHQLPRTSRECPETTLAFPDDGVSDTDPPTAQHLSECATTPAWRQRFSQAWLRLLHSLARRRLSPDDDERLANAQDPSSRVRERDTAHEQIRAPRRRIGIGIELGHDAIPDLLLDERHLPPSAAIHVAHQSPTFD